MWKILNNHWAAQSSSPVWFLLNQTLTVLPRTISHAYFVVWFRFLLILSTANCNVLVRTRFLFLLLSHYECWPCNIFGFSKDKHFVNQQENQSQKQSQNGNHHEYDVRNEVRICDWCRCRTIDLLRHEDEYDDQDDRYDDADDWVNFRIGRTPAGQAPNDTEDDCDNDNKSSYTDAEDSSWWVLAVNWCQ